MNMAQTLAVYAVFCSQNSDPFIFPGSHEQWNALTDVTDAEVLAKQIAWAAATLEASGQAYNISNGDVFRWRWLWPKARTSACKNNNFPSIFVLIEFLYVDFREIARCSVA